LFTASRGQGAFLNDRRLRASQNNKLALSLIGTGFPYSANRIYLDDYLKMLHAVINKTSGVRRGGSAALDLAYVASGRFDASWETGLKPWDVAAGAILVREAGGMITDLEGHDTFMQSGKVLAGGLKIHRAMEELIRPHLY